MFATHWLFIRQTATKIACVKAKNGFRNVSVSLLGRSRLCNYYYFFVQKSNPVNVKKPWPLSRLCRTADPCCSLTTHLPVLQLPNQRLQPCPVFESMFSCRLISKRNKKFRNSICPVSLAQRMPKRTVNYVEKLILHSFIFLLMLQFYYFHYMKSVQLWNWLCVCL